MPSILNRAAGVLHRSIRALTAWGRPDTKICHYNDGAMLAILRERGKSGSREVARRIRCGPNHVHVCIKHPDGTVTDLGVGTNLLTNIGRDWWAQAWGFPPAGQTLASGVSTATSGTTIQDTGSVWTASNLATPQLGVAGLRVYAAPHVSTNPVVWGNIISNTTHIATIDQWWKMPAAGGGPPVLGTTPTLGDSFAIAHGGVAAAAFVALSTDAAAASASDKTLASEVTTNGGQRVLGTYAHTYGAGTLTLTNTFTASGTITAIHKAGLFAALSAAGADPMMYETVFSNGDATLANLDTLALTWTFTLSG